MSNEKEIQAPAQAATLQKLTAFCEGLGLPMLLMEQMTVEAARSFGQHMNAELAKAQPWIRSEPEAPAQAAPSAGEVENKARTMHELSTVERDEAIRAFEAAHGDRFAAGFANDRAWVEGYAHARAALSHKEPKP